IRRRKGRRARRRVATWAFALAVFAGGSVVAIRIFAASPHSPRPKIEVAATWPAASLATPTAAAAGRECPAPSGDSPPPVILSSTSGRAGSSVEVSGTFEPGFLWLQ